MFISHLTPARLWLDFTLGGAVHRFISHTGHCVVFIIMIHLLVVLSSQQITIGKIYAAKLIYESFKEMKRRRGSTTSFETVSKLPLLIDIAF